jgi:signal transduction histidine kinase
VTRVDLEPVTDVATMLTRTRFPSVEVVVAVGRMPMVLGDSDLLLLALQELLANAVEFRRHPHAAVVAVSASIVRGTAVLRVADLGIGVAPTHHEKIFTPLHRVHPDHEHRGEGMGLAIARAVATAHEGTLVLESSTPEGSVFRLSWPQIISLVGGAATR